MPYVTSIEHAATRRGQRQGIESLLRVRFGDEGVKLMPEIREIHEEETLQAILKALETATTLDEVRRIWAPPAARAGRASPRRHGRDRQPALPATRGVSWFTAQVL